MEKITLNSPILIDDEEIKELTYDVNAVTNEEYLDAAARRKVNNSNPTVPVNDMALLFAWGVQAILSANRDKNWTAEDFTRVRGADNWQIAQIGYAFFTGSPGEQAESNSGEQ